MIEVSHLSKKYGTHPAIEDLSFTVGDGQIFGLLGHVRVFGEAYVEQTIAAAASIIDRADQLGF